VPTAVRDPSTGDQIRPSGRFPRSVRRVAERNHLSVARVQRLVDRHTEGRTPGFMGEPRVNVLALDIAIEDLVAKS
jgi:K+-transporting ATPase c subunit